VGTMTWIDKPQRQLIFPEMPEDELRAFCDPDNEKSPFFDFVGNRAAVNKLNRMLFTALDRDNHDMSDMNIALLGPASTGKTTLAKMLAQGAGLPFVELNPKEIGSNQDIFLKISRVLAQPYKHSTGHPADLTLRAYNDAYHYYCPPCVVLIDEAHQMPRDVQGGLLTATEKDDHRLVTGQGVILDTENVCWILATTDRGRLGTALDSRFVKAYLKPYTVAEMAVIIQRKRQQVPFDVCGKIALYCGRMAREALDFATEVIAEQYRSGGDWMAAVETIREEQGIDEFGMPEVYLSILKALGNRGPISKNGLRDIARCEVEELDEYILPVMRQLGLVQTTSRGVCITAAGLAELEKRGVGHGQLGVIPQVRGPRKVACGQEIP
jgi:Holliday junction resolvasome RuvABC ATP-dependent DNA helicase subunit